MERKRQTSAGVSVESRIASGTTLFFKLKDKERAYENARRLTSYVYDCYEDVEHKDSHGRKFVTCDHVGYCVPK